MSRRLVITLVACFISVPLLAADGAAVYKSRCQACHGADGSGNTPVGKTLKVASLASPDVQKLTDAQLEAIVKNGKGKMPAFAGKISDDDIHAVVTFIRGFKK